MSTSKGKRAICICEQSKDMPWCDGSHARGVRPRLVDAAIADKGFVLCDCGASKELPFCDKVGCADGDASPAADAETAD